MSSSPSDSEQGSAAQEVAERLLEFALFEGFTAFGVERFVNAGSVLQEAPGYVVCSEGDPAGDVVLVLSGELEVFVNRDGKDVSIATIAPGKILGEIALLSDLPRTASVRAVTEVGLLSWNGDTFRRLLYGDAGFARRIFRDSLRAVIDGEKRMIAKHCAEQ